jgi:hypothetical protein
MGECPTESWWWNGIPARTPSALLIWRTIRWTVARLRVRGPALVQWPSLYRAIHRCRRRRRRKPDSVTAGSHRTTSGAGEANGVRSVEARGHGRDVPGPDDAVSRSVAVRRAAFVALCGWSSPIANCSIRLASPRPDRYARSCAPERNWPSASPSLTEARRRCRSADRQGSRRRATTS